MIIRIVQLLFNIYFVMLFIRVISSWFPNLSRYKILRFVYYYTDPYLNLFRRFIPPIGGVLDLSPLVAFIAFRILEKVVLHLLA